jgi:hypothetical protein
MDAPPISLDPIRSEAIRWIVKEARRSGNEITALAPWTKAIVAHMRDGLTPALKEKVAARWPALQYFIENGTPHNEPDEGYIEEGFAVSFPRPR